MHLIFVVSQPRAGSTLLQRILSAHPLVHSVNEPWLLLPALYPLRHDDTTAAFDHRLAMKGIGGFLDTLSNGESAYVAAAGAMYRSLYEQSAREAGKQVFVDKTPRYYYIVPEIREAFPDASIVVLLRNPLAVLASMIDTWTGVDVRLLSRGRDDLLLAPVKAVEAMASPAIRGIEVRYENLVKAPEQEVPTLCGRLGLDYVPDMVVYGKHEPPKGPLGDRWGVTKHDRPDASGVDRWVSKLDNPRLWPWFNEYLERLGRDLVTRMGYDWTQMNELVQSRKPRSVPSVVSPFSQEASSAPGPRHRPSRGRLPLWQRVKGSLQLRGPAGTLVRVVAYLRTALSRPRR